MQETRYVTRSILGDRVWTEVLKFGVLYLTSVVTLLFLNIHLIAVFILSMVIVLGYAATRTAVALYVLNDEGLAQELKPLFRKSVPRHRFFRWDEVKWYEDGSDWNTGGSEFRYLKIGFHSSPVVWNITTQNGESADFGKWVEAFLLKVHSETEASKLVQGVDGIKDVQRIERRKSFYDSIWSKVLSVFFILITALFSVLILAGGLIDRLQIFRVFFILIPATAYMVYRSFFKRK